MIHPHTVLAISRSTTGTEHFFAGYDTLLNNILFCLHPMSLYYPVPYPMVTLSCSEVIIRQINTDIGFNLESGTRKIVRRYISQMKFYYAMEICRIAKSQ